MNPLLAAYADKLFKDVFDRIVTVGSVAGPVVLVFGLAYWWWRTRAVKRETARRQAWLQERREKREAGRPTPPKA